MGFKNHQFEISLEQSNKNYYNIHRIDQLYKIKKTSNQFTEQSLKILYSKNQQIYQENLILNKQNSQANNKNTERLIQNYLNNNQTMYKFINDKIKINNNIQYNHIFKKLRKEGYFKNIAKSIQNKFIKINFMLLSQKMLVRLIVHVQAQLFKKANLKLCKILSCVQIRKIWQVIKIYLNQFNFQKRILRYKGEQQAIQYPLKIIFIIN
ncbi:hypothetical protein TTHERM_000481390 (macronuclear) [Tetrahymena thermophila SB210]|uniref:Uncharacterized protein n=1 Tax=Tetrahymena thermophila (strain SB210) TaxID=312017 RepID=W7XJE1_TETTS|nr:hypothetical protein TTHERM_000481390 [Tetrahymena thermophila SB210]EWS74074.1 hypothetical protein TTHERM_000481390 [Tetrahymena thermophila SB210]|eukprot:XP_012653407.1 hypothetical protein TTHERM_000481390 [Tetrahymena thermophila SB210]